MLFLARLRDEHAQATAARGRAEASELQALRRADLAILAQARGALAEDLVEALSLTGAVDLRDPDNLRRARLTALAAQARGAPDQVLRGHPRRIEDLAPLSDGRLVSVDVGGEVRRWDLATGLGEVMVDLQAPHGRVLAAAAAPVWAAIAGDRAYVVRGDEAGENIAIAPLYQGSYNTHEYALSRHGETLAALGRRLTPDRQDAAAYTWDLLTRPAFAQPLAIKHRRKTAISPDGATLATLDDDDRVVLISGATITPVPELRSVNHFSASGRYLIGGSVTTPPTTVAIALADRSQVSLGQGSVVSTTLDDRALVSEHDTTTGPLREPSRLTLRSLTTGELLWTADLEITKAVIHALWGRRGGFALPESGGRFALHLDDRWQLRSLQTGALVQTLATGPHLRGVFLADGGFAVAHDTELWLWAAPPSAGPDYYAASSASDGSHAIAYPWPEQALVLLRHADGHTRPLTCFAGVRPHELARTWPRLAVDGRGRVAVVDAAGGVCLEDAGTRRDLAVPSRATSVALAERGPGLAVGLLDGSVLGFSAPDAAPQRWQLDGPVAQVWVVGALAGIVARTGRGTVVALQPGDPEPTRLGVAAVDGERHDVRVVPHPVRSDAVAVLLGHEDAIVFHEAGRGVKLRRPAGFSLEPAAAYGPGGRQFAVALADRRLLVLSDLESAGREYTLPEDARAVAFVDEHELVAVGDSGSQIRLDLAIGEAVVVQRAWVRHPAAPTFVSVAADGVIRVDSVGSLASARVDAVPRDPAGFLAWLAPRTR